MSMRTKTIVFLILNAIYGLVCVCVWLITFELIWLFIAMGVSVLLLVTASREIFAIIKEKCNEKKMNKFPENDSRLRPKTRNWWSEERGL